MSAAQFLAMQQKEREQLRTQEDPGPAQVALFLLFEQVKR